MAYKAWLKGLEEAGEREEERFQANKAIASSKEKSDEDFVSVYMRPRPEDNWESWSHPTTGAKYSVSLISSSDLNSADFEACYGLIDQTSSDAYRASAGGWHPDVKKEEMRSPGLRYLLVKRRVASDNDDDGRQEGGVRGFISFMPTWECDASVMYVYELHIQPQLQGTGLGRILMSHACRAACHIPRVTKVMLTCFKSNEGGMAFYRKLGFEEDENSPSERKLRSGRVVAADYVILSWRVGEASMK